MGTPRASPRDVPPVVHLPPARRRIDARTWDAVSALCERAEARLREADERAARVEAKADAARQRGLAEGRAEGLSRLAAAASALDAARARLVAEAEPQLVTLAVALARSLVGELALRESGVVAFAARQALERVPGAGHVVLRAHPDDLPALREALGDGAGAPRLAADPSLERGGVIAVTEGGWVDASIAGRLDRLTEALRHGAEGVPP